MEGNEAVAALRQGSRHRIVGEHFMKKLHILLSLLSLTPLNTGTAHAELLTYFNFNDATSGTASTLRDQLYSSDGGSQNSTISTNFALTTIGSQAGTTVNSTGVGDSPNRSLALQSGTSSTNSNNNGAYIQFGINTSRYKDTILTFATDKNTSDGFTENTFSYSIDNGSKFVTPSIFSSYNPPLSSSGFGLKTFDLSAIDATDNKNSLILRLTFNGAIAATGSPNNRLDNIQVNATATPEPETWAMMVMGLGALALYGWKRKKSEGNVAFGSRFAV